MSIATTKPGDLLTTVKRAIVMFQIRRLDRQYIRLNRDLDWYQSALSEAQTNAYFSRVELMLRRRVLQKKLQGN